MSIKRIGSILLCCLILILNPFTCPIARSHPFLWDNGTLTGLETLGNTNASARDINNLGQIVGGNGGDSSLGTAHVALWDTNLQIVDLGSPSAGNTMGSAINDLGQIAGTNYGRFGAFFWDSTTGFLEVGDLGGYMSWAFDINNSGQIVGQSNPPGQEVHAYIWSAELGTINLGTLGGDRSSAIAINNQGVVVGMSTMASGGNHAFRWTLQDGITDLGDFSLGGTGFNIYGFNDLNQIVGKSDVSQSSYHAYIWSESAGLQDLNDLIPIDLGWVLTEAFDINNVGQIVGRGMYNGNEHHFIWEDGSLTDLGIFGSPGNSYALSINDHGQVVGWGEYPPPGVVPEPSTMLLLGSGLIGLAGFRRKLRT